MAVMKMNLVIQESLRKQIHVDVVDLDVRRWLTIEWSLAVMTLPVLELAVSFTNLATFGWRKLPVFCRDR